MRIKFTIFLIFCGFSLFSSPKREEVMDYIQLYKTIAVQEMHMYGIPASIKLAQAILESNAGMSDLAREANNHFGIKCGGVWDGPTFYKKDDDRDHKGRLIPSCFRVFEDASSSYSAHSQFLLDPAKTFRYGPLFKLDKTDYRSWAWGLRKAGYATNPAYANLLINIIETYGLYTFDYYEESNVKYVRPEDMVAKHKNIRSHETLERNQDNKIVKRPGKTSKKPAVEQKTIINKKEALIARKGQTMEQLAGKYNVQVSDIVRYNDLELDADDYLRDGDIVFLEKKKRWYRGNAKSHTVKEGETLHDIAQKYGIRIGTLERKNRINAENIPIPGEKIILRGSKARGDQIPLTYKDVDIVESPDISTPTLKHHRQMISAPEKNSDGQVPPLTDPETDESMPLPEPEKSESIQTIDLDRPDIFLPESKDDPKQNPYQETPEDQKISDSKIIRHDVKKGETLYSLSRKYGISIQTIMEINHLDTDQLRVGQILKIAQ